MHKVKVGDGVSGVRASPHSHDPISNEPLDRIDVCIS
jgi:hypothetical protein